jgi:hypothetical protein
MKLFKSLLVAPAVLGLLAPVVANANEVNLNEIANYSDIESVELTNFSDNDNLNPLLAGGEGLVDDHGPEDSFSSTTTMDGKAIMWGGAVDGIDNLGSGLTETIQTGYTYTMNLNTSFTGDDNLYVRLKGGENGGTWSTKETYHIETKDTSDALKVDKIWYQFPVGESITAFVGPRIENYYMYVTPSIYQPGALKSMKLGGNSNFGASTDVGMGFKYEADNGFAVASNIVDKSADGAGTLEGTSGLLGKYSTRKWDTQVAYTTDRWHLSATLSDAQNWTSQSYNATKLAAAMKGSDGDTTGYALRAYWRPENVGTATPEVSFGYDIKSADTPADTAAKEADSYFVGLTWRDMFQAEDRIGFGVTQPLKVTECNGTCASTEVDPLVWEAYYAFKPNDSMEIRPAVFGGTDVEDSTLDDIFGVVVTTSFKF